MRRAYQHYTWRQVAAQLLDIYNNAADAAPGYLVPPHVADHSARQNLL
jgi:hypothetical protein